MEAGFAGSRHFALVRRTRPLALVHIVVNLCIILAFFLHRSTGSEVARGAFLMQCICHSAMFVYMALVLICRRVWELGFFHRHPVFMESTTVAIMILSMTLFTFSNVERSLKLQGYSLTEAYMDGYSSDSPVLLTLDIFVTCTHLGLPIRWFVMAPLEIAAVLLYVLMVGLGASGEPTRNIFANGLCLVSLVAISAVGKRTAEMEERQVFLTMISEKALRCKAEFELAQAAQTTGEEARSEARSEQRSDALTDRSGPIFEPPCEKGGDRTEQLRLVAEKGDSEHWRIPASDVRLLSEEALGRGSFGSIQRAVFCGMLVAVKCPRLELGSMRVADLCNEIRILRHLRHPNIVMAHGAVVLPDEQRLYLVLELIQGPKLSAFLLPRDPIRTPSGLQRCQIMLGVCGALLYMHTRQPHIVHGDLKGENIMVELSGASVVPKVLDFGLSRVINVHSKALGGTLSWMAPEVSRHAPVRCSADIYSLGHVLRFCATSVAPERKQGHIFQGVLRKQPPLPTWPEGCAFGPGYQELVHSCLEQRPEHRPCVEEVYRRLMTLSQQLRLPSEAYLQQVQQLAELMDSSTSLAGQHPCLRKSGSQLPSLPEEEAPDATVATCSEGLASQSRRFAELQETSRVAMQAMLLNTFARWNVKGQAESCCERHALAKLSQELCQSLACGRVQQLDSEQAGSGKSSPTCNRPGQQCLHCGVLYPRGANCDVCGCQSQCAACRRTTL